MKNVYSVFLLDADGKAGSVGFARLKPPVVGGSNGGAESEPAPTAQQMNGSMTVPPERPTAGAGTGEEAVASPAPVSGSSAAESSSSSGALPSISMCQGATLAVAVFSIAVVL